MRTFRRKSSERGGFEASLISALSSCFFTQVCNGLATTQGRVGGGMDSNASCRFRLQKLHPRNLSDTH